MPEPAAARRSGRRQRRERVVSGPEPTAAGIAGGLYRPLTPNAVERIHQAALKVLERTGMAEPTPTVRDPALEKGCTLDDGGRLLFPRGLIGEAPPYDLPIVDPARFAEDLDRAACLKRIRETYAAGYALPGSPADPPRPGKAGSQIQDLRRA